MATHTRAAFAAIFLTDAVSYLVIARMVYVAARRSPFPDARREGQTVAPASPFRNPRFLLFTAANGVLSLYDTMLVAMLPIWVIQRTALPGSWIPVLIAVNTVLTVLLQGYVARFARTVEGALRLVWYSAFALIAGCAFFVIAQRSPLVLALAAATGAVIATTLAENTHAAAGWELSDALAPPGAQARYLGVFSMGLSGQRIIGPILLVAVLLPLGGWAWALLAALFAAAAAIVVWTARTATP